MALPFGEAADEEDVQRIVVAIPAGKVDLGGSRLDGRDVWSGHFGSHGVGFALKQHQRAWGLDRDLSEMTWTFDPLVSRNARFNLTKLGAHASEYAVDFYGPMMGEMNANDQSDRLVAVWPLTSDESAVKAKTARLRLGAPTSGYLDEGYLRIKLKIEPGWDLAPVRAVRERFGPDLLLQVDANTAYTLADARHLALLDPFDLLLMEQPMKEDDLLGHANLARLISTPICLDESIGSARDAATAITLGACSIINVKPARVGGYLEARRIHDVAAAHGVPVWCGGMLETGIGRAANVALAALPNFVLPGDTSASNRYFAEDLTAPFELENGHLRVPTGPGIGVEVLFDVLNSVTARTDSIRF